VLVFIGTKMLTHQWVEIGTAWSLGIVIGILTVAIVASLLRPTSPEETVPDPTALGTGEYRVSEARKEIEEMVDEQRRMEGD